MALAAPGKIHTVKATSFEQINENLELLKPETSSDAP